MSIIFKHKFLTGIFAAVGAAFLSLSATPAFTQEASAEPKPGVVVREATDRIMAVVREAPDYFDEDPDRYFELIGVELDRVVDFRGFARGVMGDHASSERYRSLDAAGKETLKTQLNSFTAVLRDALIKTYSKGLLAFGGSRVELADTDFAPGSTRVASVTQLVYGDEGPVYTVKYQMGQYRDGSWQLRNLIIENINLGEIFRNQFEAAVDEAEGDVDYVIANWDAGSISRDEEGSTDG